MLPNQTSVSHQLKSLVSRISTGVFSGCLLDVLERKKQDKTPDAYCFLVRMMQLRPGPRIRRANIESKTIDTSHLGAVNVVGPGHCSDDWPQVRPT